MEEYKICISVCIKLRDSKFIHVHNLLTRLKKANWIYVWFLVVASQTEGQ